MDGKKIKEVVTFRSSASTLAWLTRVSIDLQGVMMKWNTPFHFLLVLLKFAHIDVVSDNRLDGPDGDRSADPDLSLQR